MLLVHFFLFQIYLHETGVEYWLQCFLFPGNNPSIAEIDGTSKVAYIKGTLKYIVHKNINTDKNHCSPLESMESFTKCAFDQIEETGCTPIMTKIGKFFNESNICSNYTIFNEKRKKIFEKMKNLLKNNGSYSNCLKPCKTISYDASFREMYQNAR